MCSLNERWLSSITPKSLTESTVTSSFPRSIIEGTVVHFNICEDPKMQNFVLVGLIRSRLAQHQDAMHVKSLCKFSMAMSMSVYMLKKETYNFESAT